MGRRFLLIGLPVIVLAAAAGTAWTLMAKGYPPGDPADESQVGIGAALYEWNCARCHGEDLSGELGWAKDEVGLSDEEIASIADRLGDVAPAHDSEGQTARLGDDVLFRVIDEGPGEVLDHPQSRMPGFHDRLSEDEIWAIIAFMKSHWTKTAMAE